MRERVYARVTRYYFAEGQLSGWATDEQPIYVTGLKTDVDPSYEFDEDNLLWGPLVPEDETVSVDSSDIYQLVSVDDLPDEVYVELAKRALLDGVIL